MQGEQYSKAAAALRDGDLDAADLTAKHRLLLEFVETLTRHAYRITDEQVQRLRDAGWTDAQIAEAVYGWIDLFAAQAELEALAKEAHEKVCPYSHATRGNVPVEFEVVGG